MKEIKILYLYPDILDLYGDIGNIKVLKYRLEQRGYTATIDKFFNKDANEASEDVKDAEQTAKEDGTVSKTSKNAAEK